MKILAFDTCISGCSAALLEDGKITCAKKEYKPSQQAETLMILLEEALRAKGLEYKNLDLIAVTNGPGSFTGTRIGLMAAKGIALVTGVPIFAASTLEVAAFAAAKTEKITIIQDAGRGMIYMQEFPGKNGFPTLISRADVLASGVIEVKEIRAESLARLAAANINRASSGEEILPLYIRPPDAKLPGKCA